MDRSIEVVCDLTAEDRGEEGKVGNDRKVYTLTVIAFIFIRMF